MNNDAIVVIADERSGYFIICARRLSVLMNRRYRVIVSDGWIGGGLIVKGSTNLTTGCCSQRCTAFSAARSAAINVIAGDWCITGVRF